MLAYRIIIMLVICFAWGGGGGGGGCMGGGVGGGRGVTDCAQGPVTKYNFFPFFFFLAVHG